MKRFLTTALVAATFLPVWLTPLTPTFPGGQQRRYGNDPHCGDGRDLNAQHQQVTKTNEGVWAANSGSISADEAALSSTKPAFAGDPSLMPHGAK